MDLASDGAEALRSIASAEPDLVVLDVLMPEVDGLAACRRLREQGSRVPVLMLTARERGSASGSTGSTPAPTTTWSSRSRSRSCSPGSARCCGAAARIGEAPLRFADLVLDPATREVRRRRQTGRADQDRVQPPRAVPAQPPPGADAASLIFERVWGYDFGLDLERARRLHRLPAPEDRGGRRAAADPDRARRRLHAARVVNLRGRLATGLGWARDRFESLSFRARVALVAALAVAVVAVVSSALAYILVENQLRGEVDNALRQRWERIQERPFDRQQLLRGPAGPNPRRRPRLLPARRRRRDAATSAAATRSRCRSASTSSRSRLGRRGSSSRTRPSRESTFAC